MSAPSFSARVRLLAVALTAVLVAGMLGLAGQASKARAADGSTVPRPTVTGPITGGLRGHALFDSWFDVSTLGYQEAEYFLSGTAASSTGAAPAPYTTRIMVTRPKD